MVVVGTVKVVPDDRPAAAKRCEQTIEKLEIINVKDRVCAMIMFISSSFVPGNTYSHTRVFDGVARTHYMSFLNRSLRHTQSELW